MPCLLAARAEEGKPSAGGSGRRSEGNMWGGVGETVITYIFVRCFCGLYKHVDFAH